MTHSRRGEREKLEQWWSDITNDWPFCRLDTLPDGASGFFASTLSPELPVELELELL
jgi:hypothetical protein